MQLYRLTGTLKVNSSCNLCICPIHLLNSFVFGWRQNGHQKGHSDFQVTDAYRIPANLGHDFESDSDPEPPPPPRLDYLDPPLSPRPSRAKRIASPASACSTISSIQGGRAGRGSWTRDSAARDTPPSVPQCKIIPLNPLLSGSESETSELVNARYPYGIADESMDEWAMLEPDVRTYSSRTTNPMLRKNQYWV